MMSFNDFVKKFSLKNKATSNIKIQKVLTSIGWDNVNIYLRDGPFSSDIGTVNLHPSKGTHWVCYINDIILIVMVVHLQRNYLNLLSNEIVNVYIQNTKYKV